MNKTMTRINGARLLELFKEKDVNTGEFSINLGYSKNYINNACSRNIIRVNVVWAIEERLGIPLEEYEEEKPVEGVIVPAQIGETVENRFSFTKEELQEVIRTAVIMALQDGQSAIFGAVWGALNLYKKGGEK